jgi:tRNA(fMet)-specific endonuclease VapC
LSRPSLILKCAWGHRPEGLPRHVELVDAFCARLDAILPWDRAAVDATTEIKVALRMAGTPIGPNDTAIAGHAIAAGAVLVTNNTREFERYRVLCWKTG